MKVLAAIIIVVLILRAAWLLCMWAVRSALDDMFGGGMFDGSPSPRSPDDVQ